MRLARPPRHSLGRAVAVCMTVFGAPQRTRREREREAGGSAAGGAAARAPPRPYLAHGRSSSSLGIAGAASRGRDTSRLPASVLGRQPPRRAVTAPDSSARPPRQSRYRRLLRDDEAEALELLGGGTGGAGGAMRPVTPVVQALGPELRSSLTRSRGLVAELDAERGRLRGLVAQAGGSTARLERLAAGAPGELKRNTNGAHTDGLVGGLHTRARMHARDGVHDRREHNTPSGFVCVCVLKYRRTLSGSGRVI